MSPTADPIIPNRGLRLRLVALAGVMLVAFAFTDVHWRSTLRDGSRLGDWQVYWVVSPAFFDGRDPYAVSDSRGTRYSYPPFFAVTIAPLTRLSCADSATAWCLLNIAILWGIYAESRRLLTFVLQRAARQDSPPSLPAWLTTMSIVSTALPAVGCLQQGQMAVTMLWLSLLGARLVLTSARWISWCGAGIVLMIAVAIKLTPALPAATLVFQLLIARPRTLVAEPRRRAGALVAGLAAGGLLWFLLWPSAFIGWSRNLQLLQLYVTRVVPSGANMDFLSPMNQSLTASIRQTNHLLGNPLTEASAAVLTMALLLGLLALLVVTIGKLARRGAPLDHFVAFALSMAATVAVSPVTWNHHFLLVAPAVTVVPLWLTAEARPAAARSAAIVYTLLLVCYYIYRNVTFAVVPFFGLTYTLWLAVVTAVVLATVSGTRAVIESDAAARLAG